MIKKKDVYLLDKLEVRGIQDGEIIIMECKGVNLVGVNG